MVKKKRVILSFVPTDKNLLILQNMGILNKHGRSSGKINFNDWLNRAVYENVGIDNPGQNGELEQKVILSEIHGIQKKRDDEVFQAEKKLKELAQRLAELKGQKKVVDYES